MIQDIPAIETSRPPEAMLKVVNPVLRFGPRRPLGHRMGNLLVLGFSGRKTGRIPVSAHRSGGELFVLTGARCSTTSPEARTSRSGRAPLVRADRVQVARETPAAETST